MPREDVQVQWELMQCREANRWGRPGELAKRREEVEQQYVPLLQQWLAEDGPATPRVLDVGSGLVCAARYLQNADSTYLDPLMPAFLIAHSECLPRGRKLCGRAESLRESDASMDVVLCLDVLDRCADPLAALAEMHRVLRPGGLLCFSLTTYTSAGAAVRRFISNRLNGLREDTRLHFFTRESVQRLLAPLFPALVDQLLQSAADPLLPGRTEQVWLFCCRKPSATEPAVTRPEEVAVC